MDKITVELTTVELTILILGLEQRIELMKSNDFNSVIEYHKKLHRKMQF